MNASTGYLVGKVVLSVLAGVGGATIAGLSLLVLVWGFALMSSLLGPQIPGIIFAMVAGGGSAAIFSWRASG